MVSTGNTIDVGQVVDGQPLRGFTLMLFLLCFLSLLSEGYDLGVVGIAAPGIVKTFGIGRPAMAPVFSFALFGMLIGALSAGIIGDRIGRKRCVLAATALIAVSSLACAVVTTLPQMFATRFAVGLGMGALLPNVTALMAEYMPKRVRGTFTTFAFMGITFGGILPGVIGSLIGEAQWRVLFLVGGAVPLVVLPALALLLPESLKFLVVSGRDDARLRRYLQRIDPDLPLVPESVLVLHEPRTARTSLGALFQGRLGIVTPALWLCFIAIMMVNFFVNSWLTLVLRDLGFTGPQAARIASLYYVGGVCGGFSVGLLLDRIGPIALVGNALMGVVVAVMLGNPHNGATATHLLVLLVGFSILGTQVGMSSLAGMLYTTAIRSKGAGSAHSVGRLGAIAGPLLAGRLIAADVPMVQLFLVPAVPLIVAAAGFFTVTWAWSARPLGRSFRHLHPIQPNATALG